MLRDLFAKPRKSTVPLVLAGCFALAALTVLSLVGLAAVLDKWLPTPHPQRSERATARTASKDATSSRQEPKQPTVTPAQRRVAAAAELQRIFDSSDLKFWKLKFTARGKRCDILHVQGDVNLYPEMMEALGYGTVEYGRILPGGVNKNAFGAGFRDVVYTNPTNSKFKAFGSSRLTGKQARNALICTDDMAAALAAAEDEPVVPYDEPKFEPLSWTTATVGKKLYNGSYRHEATIVSLDPANDLMHVQYVESGRIEPKRLTAVARYWYVKQQ